MKNKMVKALSIMMSLCMLGGSEYRQLIFIWYGKYN